MLTQSRATREKKNPKPKNHRRRRRIAVSADRKILLLLFLGGVLGLGRVSPPPLVVAFVHPSSFVASAAASASGPSSVPRLVNPSGRFSPAFPLKSSSTSDEEEGKREVGGRVDSGRSGWEHNLPSRRSRRSPVESGEGLGGVDQSQEESEAPPSLRSPWSYQQQSQVQGVGRREVGGAVDSGTTGWEHDVSRNRPERGASSSSSSSSSSRRSSWNAPPGDSGGAGSGSGKTGWPHNLPRPDSSFWSEQQQEPSQREEEEKEKPAAVAAAAEVETEEFFLPAEVKSSKESVEKDELRRTGRLRSAVSKDEDADDEPRTGWLHNTVSPSEIKKKEQEGASSGAAASSTESPARKLLRLEIARKMRNHRIISPPAFHPCGDGRRIVVTEHKISVPLDRKDEDSEGADEDGTGFARAPGEGLLLSGLGGGSAKDDGPRIDVYFAVAELIEKDEDEHFFASSSMALTPGAPNDVRTQRQRADAYVSRANLTDADSMILYLQGGPGFGAPPPVSGLSLAEKGSWAGAALSKGYKRIVLMDQRGTGRSAPITKQTLERTFPDLFALDDIAGKTTSRENWRESIGTGEEEGGEGEGEGGPRRVAEQLDKWEALNPELAARVGVGLGQAAEYAACFRADSIVRDAEDVKDALLQPRDDGTAKIPRPYGAVLGQSFGGFCTMTYLSLVPHPPKICLLTGGIAPMLTPPLEVYDRLWDRVRERNVRYYETYPGDVPLVKRIVRRLLNVGRPPVVLPSGGVLTARRFLQLGLGLGGSPSAFASLHSLVGSALLDPDATAEDDDDLSRAFLKAIDGAQPFDTNPIYYLLHESIYADGSPERSLHGHNPTDWAAHRSLLSRSPSTPADAELHARPPSEFDYRVTSHPSDARPTCFFGEMVFPWMSAGGDYAELSGFGMRILAQSLASKDDWGRLYDERKMREALLGSGSESERKCRAAAAVYYDDMYVDFDCSMKVAARGGPLEGCKVWITNEYQHSGLRDDGATIFGKLLGMAKGSVNTPS